MTRSFRAGPGRPTYPMAGPGGRGLDDGERRLAIWLLAGVAARNEDADASQNE
jgi:hypothetical protein